MRLYVMTRDGLQDVTIETLRQFRQVHNEVVWIDVHHPTPRGMAVLQEVMDLHPLAVEDAFHQRERPKIEEYPNHLFVVINDIVLRYNELEFPELDIFLGANYLVTVHYRCYEKMEKVRERLLNAEVKRPFTPDFLFYSLFDTIVDGYFPLFDRLEHELDQLTEIVFENPSNDVQKRLFQLKRMLHRSWRVLGYERDVMNIILRRELRFIREADIVNYFMRDVQDHLLLITDITISYRENLNSIFQLYIAGTSIQLNLVVNRLTGITLIIGIATVISGFYGMNFEQTWPSFDTPWGVPFVIFMIITLTVVLLIFLRRLKVF